MLQQFCISVVAVSLLAASALAGEWDKLIDQRIAAYEAMKERKSIAFPEVGARLQTLFHSHRLSHVQVFSAQDGKRSLGADIYYGEGQLHVVQHQHGWNLVTKGAEAYEWKFGKRTGEITVADPKDLIDYAIYLTDPAAFLTYVHGLYLTKPELFEAPRPGESGCTELRFKKVHHGIRAIQLDQKRLWFCAFEYENVTTGKVATLIFSKPQAIQKIPNAVFERLEHLQFRKSPSSLRRHMTYL